jgi:ParB family chromosome partitioning protein
MSDMQEQTLTEELLELPLDQIQVNPYQPRREFAQEEIEELSQSIQSIGLIQPPVVRFNVYTGDYELISGERRYRACKMAGLEKISVIVRRSDNQQSAEASLVENLQRVDLNPLEVALSLKNLTSEFGFSQDELAQRIGKKRSTVANYLRLLTLPQDIQDGLSRKNITMGIAKVILSLEGEDLQKELYDLVVRENLTVREAEKLAAQLLQDPTKPVKIKAAPKESHLLELEDELQRRLGTKVSIQGKGKKGKVVINYYNPDDLDRLLDMLKVEV